MNIAQRFGRGVKWTVTAAGVALATYRTVAGLTWLRYGHPARPRGQDVDALLDRFMPEYEVAERHRVRIRVSAETAMRAAGEMHLEDSRLIRLIIRAREIVVGADPTPQPRGQAFRPGFVEQMASMGWGKLAEFPGRSIVMGAV